MVTGIGALRQRSSGWLRSALLSVMVAATLVATATLAQAAQSAAIVIDTKTGKVLYSSNADTRTYPASLTKMMTLYLLFEALESGKVTLNTRIKMSSHAAAQAPSKLGLKPGQTITVRDAILALVTKSANDVACAIGEHLAGSESAFAGKMTRTARAIGMSKTTFRNASGLPDAGQITTARDMALLGRALQDRFPKQFAYFATRSFKYGKANIANHNKLLGRVQGVNGIKTGYTKASGFNLVTSVNRDGRSVVAVVLGGTSGKSRDVRMTQLIASYMPKASTGPRTAALVGTPKGIGEAAPVVASAAADAPVMALAEPDEETAPEVIETASVAIANVIESEEGDGGEDATARQEVTDSAPAMGRGWKIQLGAPPSLKGAKDLLERAKSTAPKLLASTSPYTEEVAKGKTTLYRARFGGFKTKESARAACTFLAKQDFACLALQ